MKSAAIVIVFLCTSLWLTQAGEIETNKFSNRRSVTFVYRASREQVESAARQRATNLWRVEVEASKHQAVVQKWQSEASDAETENKIRARLNYREFKYFWMPPEVARRKVSEGGRIVPLRSPIWITVGALKTNSEIAFITLSRDLEEKTTLHIPYTEIPFGRGASSQTGIYRTDVDWLRNLLTTNILIAEFVGKKFYDSEIIKALETGANATKSNGDIGTK